MQVLFRFYEVGNEESLKMKTCQFTEKEVIQAEGRDCAGRGKCVALFDMTKCWERTKLEGMQGVAVREDAGELLQGPAHVVSCTACHCVCICS